MNHQTSSLAILQENVAKKPAYGRGVIKGLTDFATIFNSPPVKPAELTVTTEVLEKSIADALSGSHVAIAERNAAEKQWNHYFKLATVYIGNVANGDDVIIRKGGAVPTKSESTVAQAPLMPTGFTAKATQATGVLEAECTHENDTAGNVFILYFSSSSFKMNVIKIEHYY